MGLKTTLIVYLLLIFNNWGDVLSVTIEPIVSIPQQGKIKGKIQESRNGKSFVAYLSIPFVKKPERFQEASSQPSTWEGIRDGSKYGSVCPQFDRKSKMVIGNEDCLFLNVFTPELPTPKPAAAPNVKTPLVQGPVSKGVTAPRIRKRPVIVHIHGGSFVSQSADLFGPQYFLDEDILLVTFNYRLGVLGFFSTGDNLSISNLALRDQIQALKWVKENIGLFGGDPQRITLFGGGSAGGAMASYLMISPLSKGLFSNVISSSGNALSPWAIVHKPGKIAEKLATKLNCPLKSSKDILNCVKGKGIKDIEIARVALQGFNEDPAVPFAPVVDSWAGKDSVLPENPKKLLAEGRYNQVPWLTGVNSLNGVNLGVATVLTTPKRISQLDQDWNKLAPILFHYSQTLQNLNNVSASIREYYFGSKNITGESKGKLIDALTDGNFIHCTATAASLMSKYSPVYLYHLGYLGAYSFLDDWGLKDKLNVKGVVHGDELQHLFKLELGNFPYLNKKGDKHYEFSMKLVKLWTSFAEIGKPMEMSEKAGAEWTMVGSNSLPSALQWYNLDSSAMSRQFTFDGNKQSTLWDQLLNGNSNNKGAGVAETNKFAIGYEMSSTTKKPLASTTSKPVAPSAGSSTATSTSKSPASIPSQQTPSPPIVIGAAILKDDDAYSSTTTTTTKKPSLFSKIIG